MFRFTILQKLLFLSSLIIFLYIAYVVYGYISTKDSSKQIINIKQNILPLSLLENENQKLLEELILAFSDAAATAERDMLYETDEIKEKIEKNLFEIFKYKQDVSNRLNLLNKYFDEANKITIKLLDDETIVEEKEIISFQELTQDISILFKKEKEDSFNKLENFLEKLSYQNKNFFNISFISSFVGLFFMMGIVFYLYFSMRKRFNSVIASVKNLATDNPDFSKKMEVDDSKDEINSIIKWFNLLQSKLEENYNKLEQLKIKAEETAKVKSEFLANMSHEIRTPIHGIIGLLHLLMDKNDLDIKEKKQLKKIHMLSNSLLAIINDILDFSKLNSKKVSLDKNTFNIYLMVDEVISMVEIKALEKNLQINVKYSDDIKVEYFGDKIKISQILINLLTNAVKFTHEGSVTLYINRVSNTRVMFKVKDTGIGLQQNQMEKLFESFHQVDNSISRKYGGTGLGLAISKGLVLLMNGEIWVESKYKEGSTFIFEIELKEDNRTKKTDTYNIEDVNIAINKMKNKNILLVEDNKINQEIMLGLLEDIDINVKIANNGVEALEQINLEKYDLILMDIQMPIMDGFTVTKKIREFNKKTPIIALTADSKDGIKDKVKRYGMDDIYMKPIKVDELYKKLAKYL